MCLFECLTGRPPFLGSTPNELLIKHIQEPPPPASAFNSNVTPEMDQLILRLMAKKPENRPASAGELLSELRSVKIFHEDPQAFDDAVKAKEKEEAAASVDSTLNSRFDALRTEQKAAGIEVPEKKQPRSKKPVQKKPEKAAPAKPTPAQQAAQGQPQQPGYSQQPMMPQQPGYPQQPMMPQQPGMPPQAWPQGQPVAGQPMPGYPAQQTPAGGIPPQPGYQQPVPPQQQQVPQQTPSSPPSPQVAKPKKEATPGSVPPANSEKKADLDDLPLMDELPDII